MKKLFGELNLTWPKLIIFAIIAGVYTGVVAQIPQARDTSFADISITFEWWILFGTIIIMNSKSNLDSALKCFVFFLISQPLVYLVQVPVSELGWGIFQYYPGWFKWTLLTIPMGYIGYWLKKDKWWGLFIIVPMMIFLGYHYTGFLRECWTYFPHHLLSAIFCVVVIILFGLYIFKDKKIRKIALIIAIIILISMTVLAFTQGQNYYETDLLLSGEGNPDFDETYTAEFVDPSYGTCEILYEPQLECYKLHVIFVKQGETQCVLKAPDGTEYVYDLIIGRSTYNIKPEDSDEWRY
ncbi:MAG: hypothetical protein K5653_02380 [Clostridiales bacterium]|nr:hypothetical protein [Clostridiales bacterium]